MTYYIIQTFGKKWCFHWHHYFNQGVQLCWRKIIPPSRSHSIQKIILRIPFVSHPEWVTVTTGMLLKKLCMGQITFQLKLLHDMLNGCESISYQLQWDLWPNLSSLQRPLETQINHSVSTSKSSSSSCFRITDVLFTLQFICTAIVS